MSSSIPRKIRRRINEVVEGVELLDLDQCTRAEFDEEYDSAANFLEGNGIKRDSDYRRRLTAARETAYIHFGVKPKKVEPQEDKTLEAKPDTDRHYAGVSGRSFLRVNVEENGYSIKQLYNYQGSKSGLLWRFNKSGRIMSVNFVATPYDHVPSPIIVANGQTQEDWSKTPVQTFNIPREILRLRSYFSNDPLRVYQDITRWGHIGSSALLEGIVARTTFDPLHATDELPLRMIIDDCSALAMLRNASSIFPFLLSEGDKLAIEYRPNIGRKAG